MKVSKLFLFLSVFLTLIFPSSFLYPKARAVECGDSIPTDPNDLNSYIDNCKTKIDGLSGQKKTLSSTISYLSSQIALTQSEIAQTQNELNSLNLEILELSGKIESINYSLNDLTTLFVTRVQESYKSNQSGGVLAVFNNASLKHLVKNIEYVKKVRDHDHALMIALEKSRLDYDEQKLAKEEKQKIVSALQTKLQVQQNQLAQQKQQSELLLATTKNNEKKYQELLSKASAELAAIQAVIAGKGSETEVGPISEGDRIATIISGASPCSSGTHLHFEVVSNKSHHNPFEYLNSNSLSWDNADPAQNGTGSWRWPMRDPIRITQGYGHTSYSSIYANNVHTGVDMVNSDDYSVLAVKNGTLYRGAISCGGGTLRYVHVDHGDSDYDTYYLHVNY